MFFLCFLKNAQFDNDSDIEKLDLAAMLDKYLFVKSMGEYINHN